uniref:PawS-like protein 1e n=1 Tax=Dahlia pinnata TaxID=101596 RepID=A0A1V0JB88_DAHPI|nr:PawS-like protein 1e [Dahlia pinnata]
MIKVSVAATILALAATLAFAKASAYKTTITTITNDNGLFPYGPDSLKDNGLFPYGPDSLKYNGLFPYGPDSLKDNGLFPFGPDSLKDNGLFPYGPDSLKDNGLFPYGPDSLKDDSLKDNGLFPYGPDSLKDNGLFPYGPDSLKDNGLFPYGPDSLIRVNPKLGSTEKCRISVHLEACRMHLTQNGGQLEQCCQELKKVDDRCKCKAIQQVFDQARQQGQGQGQGQGQLMLQKKAQMLPNACMFKFHQCPIMV